MCLHVEASLSTCGRVRRGWRASIRQTVSAADVCGNQIEADLGTEVKAELYLHEAAKESTMPTSQKEGACQY